MSTPRTPQALFEVLHTFDSEIGVVMLRRRWSPTLERHLYEMTVNGLVMMTSGVVESEQALADEILARRPGNDLRVLVGGLGFGFTAKRFLECGRVGQVRVIERLPEVIAWHRQGALPWSREFLDDPRLEVRQGDFFATVAAPPTQTFDAIAVDIDDSPDMRWHDAHASFYGSEALSQVAQHLAPGGLLGLWFATDPGEEFVARVAGLFHDCRAVRCDVTNPCLRQVDTNYLVLATTAS